MVSFPSSIKCFAPDTSFSLLNNHSTVGRGFPLTEQWNAIFSPSSPICSVGDKITRGVDIVCPGLPRGPGTPFCPGNPLSPFSPFGPGGPVIPDFPALPGGPITPCAPLLPLVPWGPLLPRVPFDPVRPGGPGGPGGQTFSLALQNLLGTSCSSCLIISWRTLWIAIAWDDSLDACLRFLTLLLVNGSVETTAIKTNKQVSKRKTNTRKFTQWIHYHLWNLLLCFQMLVSFLFIPKIIFFCSQNDYFITFYGWGVVGGAGIYKMKRLYSS